MAAPGTGFAVKGASSAVNAPHWVALLLRNGSVSVGFPVRSIWIVGEPEGSPA
jgi:hypothetical protein